MVEASPFDIESHFGNLKDPRVKHSPPHALIEIIIIALCAIICGANNWVAVETRGKAKEEWLRQYLRLPNGIPSHDTFGLLFGALDPDEFRHCFPLVYLVTHPKLSVYKYLSSRYALL